MSDETKFKRAWSFIEGAQTSLDTMDSSQGGKHERSEFWRGYRHALDSIHGYLDELEAEEIESNIRPLT